MKTTTKQLGSEKGLEKYLTAETRDPEARFETVFLFRTYPRINGTSTGSERKLGLLNRFITTSLAKGEGWRVEGASTNDYVRDDVNNMMSL